MSQESQESPFKTLGQKLKIIRQKLHETIADVSGAVEIDEATLQRFEEGRECPSEDILLLLISHFGMSEEEAASLWRLAGYEPPRAQERESNTPNENSNQRNMVLVMAIDPRIIYSDGVHVSANPSGVVLNFAQNSGTPQSLTTARIGMSREQAQRVLHVLQQALQYSGPRQLPAPGQSSEEKSDQASK
jgi:transcriptional regulator with XRE-family HTH domain